MGSWGTGIYSNDTSSEVRDLCNEVYPLVGIEEGTRLILKEYADVINSDIIDNDHADFWFALADWQWKHGILTDDIKSKTIALLEAHTGIEEWEESASTADVKKRLAVMEKLLRQLKLPQPKTNIPKAKIAKPKHKPGDIIIVRTGLKENDPENWIWNIEECTDPFFYSQEVAAQLVQTLNPPYDAHDKYIAILCVGSEKTLHCEYVDDVYDEYSVYAFYDYISNQKPTIDILKTCGFLPKYLQYAGEFGADIETCGWCYHFHLFTCSFRLSKDGSERSIEKVFDSEEATRFHQLLNAKNYLPDISWNWELYEAFGEFFEEKARLERANIPYDNLLYPAVFNPALRSAEEISAIIRKEMEDLG